VKTEGEIRQKLKQVLFRHRKSFLQDGLDRRPDNCVHNDVVHLPLSVSVNDGSTRVCRFVAEDGTWNNRICDSRLGGDRQAIKCPYYACRNTAGDLKQTFRADLGLDGGPMELAHIAKTYPDVVALMWVLGEVERPETSILSFFSEEDEDD
jgi:hypothetical protein